MNKTVLITGASRGIGKSIAHIFAKNGYSLVINCSKSQDALFSLKKELEDNYHIPVLASVGNIGDYSYVEKLFEEIKSEFDGIDILINNAGISHIGLLTDMDYSDECKSFFSILHLKTGDSLHAFKKGRKNHKHFFRLG